MPPTQLPRASSPVIGNASPPSAAVLGPGTAARSIWQKANPDVSTIQVPGPHREQPEPSKTRAIQESGREQQPAPTAKRRRHPRTPASDPKPRDLRAGSGARHSSPTKRPATAQSDDLKRFRAPAGSKGCTSRSLREPWCTGKVSEAGHRNQQKHQTNTACQLQKPADMKNRRARGNVTAAMVISERAPTNVKQTANVRDIKHIGSSEAAAQPTTSEPQPQQISLAAVQLQCRTLATQQRSAGASVPVQST